MLQDYEEIDFEKSPCAINEIWIFLWRKYQINFSKAQIKGHLKRVKSKIKIQRLQKLDAKLQLIKEDEQQTNKNISEDPEEGNKQSLKDLLNSTVPTNLNDIMEQQKLWNAFMYNK